MLEKYWEHYSLPEVVMEILKEFVLKKKEITEDVSLSFNVLA